MPKHSRQGKGSKKRVKRSFAFPERETPIRVASAPDPHSPMGRATAEDGARVRTSPYLSTFVRPYVPGEFEGHQVVSEERMKVVTHVLVARIDPTSVARTRIPLTTEQAEMFQAFGVLEKEELQAVNGPFSFPQESQRLTIAAASTGVHASFLDYPRLEGSEAALETRGQQLAQLQVRIWNGIANDLEMYVRLLVPAFVFGYRLGHSMLQEMTPADQIRLLEGISPLPAPEALGKIDQTLRGRMEELGVGSVYELL
jgi:hypothetical protein